MYLHCAYRVVPYKRVNNYCRKQFTVYISTKRKPVNTERRQKRVTIGNARKVCTAHATGMKFTIQISNLHFISMNIPLKEDISFKEWEAGTTALLPNKECSSFQLAKLQSQIVIDRRIQIYNCWKVFFNFRFKGNSHCWAICFVLYIAARLRCARTIVSVYAGKSEKQNPCELYN